jgi:hypothetical protein
VNALHILKTSVIHEIQLHSKSTSMELAKVVGDNDAIHAEYDNIMME